jgi:hypothetical protein
MEIRRLNALARLLGAAASRRGIAHLLTGGAFAAVSHGVDAKKRRKKRHKKRRKKNQCPNGSEACGKTCCQTGEQCVGDQCLVGQGTCPTGEDFCAAGTFSCGRMADNAFCDCFTTIQGPTRCGVRASNTPCGACTSDAECASSGPGAFCAKETEGLCGCAQGQGFCVTLCENPD